MDSLQSLMIIQIFSFQEGRKKIAQEMSESVNSLLGIKGRAVYRSSKK